MSYEAPPKEQEFNRIKMIYVDLSDLNRTLEDCSKKAKISHNDFMIIKDKLKEVKNKKDKKEVIINIK